MAHHLHQSKAKFATCVATVVWLSGCLAPPIEPEPEELNIAPFLAFPSPDQRVVTFDSPESEEFTILGFDPNTDDETLYYVWLGEENSFYSQGQVSRDASAELEAGVYHQFEPITETIAPCDPRLQGVSEETLWVFVSDGRFLSLSDTELEVEEDRFIVSFSWVFNIRPDACL